MEGVEGVVEGWRVVESGMRGWRGLVLRGWWRVVGGLVVEGAEGGGGWWEGLVEGC